VHYRLMPLIETDCSAFFSAPSYSQVGFTLILHHVQKITLSWSFVSKKYPKLFGESGISFKIA
jgi:hypothetical protein